MSGLLGQRVLVLEDDYFQAIATAQAVTDAGGVVLGPRALERDAFEDILDDQPTVAVLDINLHGYPSFEVARVLKDGGVPFVFLTGYSHAVPNDLLGEICLFKPLSPGELVAALQRASLQQRG